MESHYLKEAALMNWKKVGRLKCLACGTALSNGDRCSRCAMVVELISELIQKQARGGLRLQDRRSNV
jgi:hypothetical protein